MTTQRKRETNVAIYWRSIRFNESESTKSKIVVGSVNNDGPFVEADLVGFVPTGWIHTSDGSFDPLFESERGQRREQANDWILFWQSEFVFRLFVLRLCPTVFFSSKDRPNRRLVLFVVDALRSDYVFDRNSSYRLKSIEQFNRQSIAINFRVRAQSPTVTLPRLKVTIQLSLNIDRSRFSVSVNSDGTIFIILGCSHQL